MSNVKPIEVKKLDNGKLAVRWSNTPRKWHLVEDPTLVAFIVWRMIDN